MQRIFGDFARFVARISGAPITFALAVTLVLAWAISGRHFAYSDTWQLFINTGTTVFTFLLVVLLQNTQNHDSRAVQLKLDELIRSVKTARNSLLNLESMSDQELEKLHQEFQRLRQRAQEEHDTHLGADSPSKGKK